MKRLLFVLLLLFPLACLGQAVRVGDSLPTQTTAAIGTDTFVKVLPNSTIQFCSHPANAVPCTNKATTYTDATAAVACSTSTPVVLSGTSSCVGQTDAQGNWGVWALPGQYDWTFTDASGNSHGPYYVTLSSGTTIAVEPGGSSDLCAKIAAAIALLPAGGGTVDARGLQGAQACSSNPFSGAAVPVTLLLGATTITATAQWQPNAGARILGSGKSKTILIAPATAVSAIYINNVADVEVAYMEIRGSGSTNAAPGIYVYGGAGGNQAMRANIHDNKLDGFGTAANSYGAVSIFNAGTVYIEHNEFTANGATLVAGLAPFQINYDVGVNAAQGDGTHTRILIRNNYFHDSLTTASIGMYDTSLSEISGNWIDQNNVINVVTSGGYGIMLYTQLTAVNPCVDNRVENNHIQNTAGTGIYMQTSPYSVVSGNTLINIAQQETTGGSLLVAGIALNTSGSFATGGYVVTGNKIQNVNWANAASTNVGDGIAAAGTTGALISNNSIFQAQRYGVNLTGVEIRAHVQDNDIKSVSAGVFAAGAATFLAITGNTISDFGNNAGNKSAITINGAVTDSVVSHNTISAPASAAGLAGVVFVSGSAARNVISNNVMTLTGGASNNAIDYRGTLGAIRGNTVTGATAAGISVTGSTTDIDGNKVLSATTYGILVNTGTGNVIRNNDISSSGTGAIDVVAASAVSDCSRNILDTAAGSVFSGFPCSGTFLSGSATVDLASVNSAACSADSADVTVTGAVVGDPVIVTAGTALEPGSFLVGRVTATNTGRFQFCNLSGAPIDRANDTYTVRVLK